MTVKMKFSKLFQTVTLMKNNYFNGTFVIYYISKNKNIMKYN